MGEVIWLDERRGRGAAAHRAAPRPRAHAGQRAACTLWFDLAAPGTYFAAERAERLFTHLRWRPALAPGPAGPEASLVAAATARATELRMPLVWPEGGTTERRAAMRVAAFAAEQDRAAAFVLAAGRLAFCGGFDLDDPEILAEAAAAAGLPLDACLRAAGDPSRDAAMEGAGRALVVNGAPALPVLAVGTRLLAADAQLGEAAAAARATCGDLGEWAG